MTQHNTLNIKLSNLQLLIKYLKSKIWNKNITEVTLKFSSNSIGDSYD